MNAGGVNSFSRQEDLLAQLRQAKAPIFMYLRSGVRLQGVIEEFDAHIIISRNANKNQMIFKHMVLTILPSHE